MIRFVQALPAGNAVQIVVGPPPGAVSWRVLRRPVDAITGPDDPAAARVADEITLADVIDCIGLVNGTTYHYRVFYRGRDGGWLAQVDHASATPMATYQGDTLDAQALVRERLELGLAVEVGRGALKASPKSGRIDVLLAPFALAENTLFPVVSVHLESDAPDLRFLGEMAAPDQHHRGGGWTETIGWASRVQLNVVGASLNPNERRDLRRAIKRIVQANMPIFYARGLDLIEFAQRDHEDAEHFNAPLYFTLGTFTCLAPSLVTDDLGQIDEVDVTRIDAITGEQSHG